MELCDDVWVCVEESVYTSNSRKTEGVGQLCIVEDKTVSLPLSQYDERALNDTKILEGDDGPAECENSI